MSRFNEPFIYGDDVFILRNGEVLLCGRYRSCQYKFLDNSMDCSIEFDLYSNLTHPLVPEKVIFYNYTTKCIFPDGGAVTVRMQQDDGPFDPEKGIALCILKKLFGGSKFNDVLREARASSNYKDDAGLRLAMFNDYLRHEHRKKKHEEAE